MSYFLKFDSGSKIELPTELDVHERVKFCEQVLDDYKDEFDIKMKNTSYRLEIMANYILAGANKDNDYPIITQYKDNKNKRKELYFSDLEHKYDKK